MFTSYEKFNDFINECRLSKEVEDTKIDDALLKQGWKYTSETPGSHWMWQKTLPDGRTLLVARETALRVEQEMLPSDGSCSEDD